MIRFCTLGGLELKNIDGEELRPILAQPKRATLLAYLALADSSTFRRRDTIVSLFWPESDDSHARSALRQAVRFLRRTLGENVLVSRGEEELGLDPAAFWIDAVEFENASVAGDHERALKLYRGAFLDGVYVTEASPDLNHWIEAKRAHFSRRAVASAWAMAESSRTTGALTEASAFAHRALGISPDDEATLRRLVSFLDDIGERSAALAAYESFARRMKTDLDADPSPETKAVVARARTRTVAPVLPTTAEAAPSAGSGSIQATEPVAIDVSAESTRTSETIDGPAKPSRSRRALFPVVAIAGALIVISVGLLAARMNEGAPLHTSIAVLPAEDLTGDTARAYIAEGLTDQLISDLAQGGGVDVINRRTMMTYSGSRKTPREIARELDAGAVVASTVQYFGDTIRMAAQLVLADDDKAIWAQTYEGSRGDLLRLQREAARAVIRELDDRKSKRSPTQLRGVVGHDPRALDLYIRGRYSWNKRGPGLLKSIGLFTEALDIDPSFALAYSGMADAYVQLGYSSALAPRDAFPKARAAAQRALSLDSTLAEPHATLAFVELYYNWNWKAAESEFKKAIALNPSYATAHEWYGLFLAAMGRFDEARAEERRAGELDPLSTAIAGTAAWVVYYAGRNEEARQELRIALRTDSVFPLGHLYLGRVHEALGQYDSALVQYDASGPLKAWVPTIAAKGVVFGVTGRQAEAAQTLEQLDSLSRHQYVTAYGVALVHAALGQKDSAFHWLNLGVRERTHWLVWLNRDPRWNNIRSDRRFASLTRTIGLPP